MIDAQGVADEVNRRFEDAVTARMVREYVRLRIIDRALHPGRHGFDLRAIDQMLQARALVREGASLAAVADGMRARASACPKDIFGRGGKSWIDFGRFGKVAMELPDELSSQDRISILRGRRGFAPEPGSGERGGVCHTF